MSTVDTDKRAAPTSMHSTAVRDVMHPGIVACSPSASLAEIARIMVGCRVHCVAVVGIDKQRAEPGPVIQGMITDSDLVGWATGPSPQARAETIAGWTAATVGPDSTVQEAAELMAERATQHLIVVDPASTAPIGVLSSLDVAKVLSRGTL